jgi:predicted GNAT family acetyltransferase
MLKITHRDIEIVIREATVEDEMRGQIIASRVQEPEAEGTRGVWYAFGDLCSHVVSSSGLPFDPLTLHEASAEEANAAYHAYLKLPRALGKLWKQAIDQVDGPADGSIVPVGEVDPNAPTAGVSKPGK